MNNFEEEFMKWIYLSLHFDDAVLSCGGLIWKQIQNGEQVEVWTIFGGNPPGGELSMFAKVLHYRWGIPEDSVDIRREEDLAALNCLGVKARHFDFLDCIYRKNEITGEILYEDFEMITSGVERNEEKLVEKIEKELSELKKINAKVVAPIGVGNHIDHRIIHKISSRLRIDMMYYLDFPYVFRDENWGKDENLMDFTSMTYVVSTTSRDKWKEAIACYSSQLSSFWSGTDEMKREIEDYYLKMNGIKLFIREN